MKTPLVATAVGSILCLAAYAGLLAEQTARTGGESLLDKSPRVADFVVHLGVHPLQYTERPPKVYCVGDEIRVTLKSERDGFAYLLYRGSDGKTTCLLPGPCGTRHAVSPDSEPGPCDLRITSPVGNEWIQLVVTEKDVPEKRIVELAEKKAFVSAVQRGEPLPPTWQEKAGAWAMHRVNILTVDGPSDIPRPRGERRCVGIFIGVSRYQDDRIPSLHVCHGDALALCETLKGTSEFYRVIVLQNEEATRENIRKAICEVAAQLTREGDDVLIFWSGHGAQCSDGNGDESRVPGSGDALDEFLIPYDGCFDYDKIAGTMLLDDTFGEWIERHLKNRRVALIIDACHSAGILDGTKGAPRRPEKRAPFNFLDRKPNWAKDSSRREVAMLASASSSETAFECKDRKSSVLAHFLGAMLTSGDAPITVKSAYASLRVDIPRYVEKNFPQEKQTPCLVHELSTPLCLRP